MDEQPPKDPPPDRPTRELANLRLEVNALTAKIEKEALPASLVDLRRTVTRAALIVAVALLVSGLLHLWGTTRVDQLERRIERLEQGHKAP